MAPVARGVKRSPGFFFVERKISRPFFFFCPLELLFLPLVASGSLASRVAL